MTPEPAHPQHLDEADEPIPFAPPTQFAPRTPPFWHRPAISGLPALPAALYCHMAVVADGLVRYKAYGRYRPVEEEQAIIPDAAIVEGSAVGGVPNPGLGGDPTRPAQQDQPDGVLSDSQSFSAAHSKP